MVERTTKDQLYAYGAAWMCWKLDAFDFLYGPLEAWHKGYGWRGMLILGVLLALACVWIRFYVKEPEVWTETKKLQAANNTQVILPLFAIFKPKYLLNTLTGCVCMGANFCVYYGCGRCPAPICKKNWTGRLALILSALAEPIGLDEHAWLIRSYPPCAARPERLASR